MYEVVGVSPDRDTVCEVVPLLLCVEPYDVEGPYCTDEVTDSLVVYVTVALVVVMLPAVRDEIVGGVVSPAGGGGGGVTPPLSEMARVLK